MYDTPVVVAFVQIASAAQMRTEQAKPYPSKTTVRVSEIAKRVNAVLAVNADWFTYHNTGIVYRNGELLRNRSDEEYDGLAIDVNGDFHIIPAMTEADYAQLTTAHCQFLCFGPARMIDGETQEIVNRKVTLQAAYGDWPNCAVELCACGNGWPRSKGFRRLKRSAAGRAYVRLGSAYRL